ncbi:MAG: hypothetical protein ABIQ44_15490, partial [Chloroflexia bacterium]
QHIIRDHKILGNAIGDPKEVALRRCVDEWLAEIGLLFLGWLSGYCSNFADTPAGERILKILDSDGLRPYYERHYPVALPWLFRQQLKGELELTPAQAPGAFELFINMYERFRNDRELLCFLDFLDGFNFGVGLSNITIENVAEAFKDPDRVVEALFKPKPQTTPLDDAIIGLLRFATFSTSLQEFLVQCASMPTLQSGFWFFYAFWYREFKKDAKAISMRAIQMASANVTDKGSQALASQSEIELDEIMTALTDGRYANALIERVPDNSLGTLSFDIPANTPPASNGWASKFGAYKKT